MDKDQSHKKSQNIKKLNYERIKIKPLTEGNKLINKGTKKKNPS